jgi:pimeloyl-ACP methyl ester carboxylesterase
MLAALVKNIDAGVLNIAYVEAGVAKGWPVVLLHGFPCDIHAYDEVAPLLTAEGTRVIVQYLRGYIAVRIGSLLVKNYMRCFEPAIIGNGPITAQVSTFVTRYFRKCARSRRT